MILYTKQFVFSSVSVVAYAKISRRSKRIVSVRFSHTRRWWCGLLLGVFLGCLIAAALFTKLDGKFVLSFKFLSLQFVARTINKNFEYDD